jgi:hypothetical protein
VHLLLLWRQLLLPLLLRCWQELLTALQELPQPLQLLLLLQVVRLLQHLSFLHHRLPALPQQHHLHQLLLLLHRLLQQHLQQPQLPHHQHQALLLQPLQQLHPPLLLLPPLLPAALLLPAAPMCSAVLLPHLLAAARGLSCWLHNSQACGSHEMKGRVVQHETSAAAQAAPCENADLKSTTNSKPVSCWITARKQLH